MSSRRKSPVLDLEERTEEELNRMKEHDQGLAEASRGAARQENGQRREHGQRRDAERARGRRSG